jgi:hypothetical protein
VKKCIIIQTHIDHFDPQGGLSLDQRKFIVDLSIKQLRWYNPGCHIIVSGHGVIEPSKDALDLVDTFIWGPLATMSSYGQVKHMPAQFRYTINAIRHAKKLGFSHVLKTRGDTLVGIKNVSDFCHSIITKENKKILLTQQTGWEKFHMGDCFIYGEINLMEKMWDMDTEILDRNQDGLFNLGRHFVKAFDKEITIENYLKLLKKHCSFRDVTNLKFTCTRYNFHTLDNIGWGNIINEIKNYSFDFENYHWGKYNRWHLFENEKMTRSVRPFYFSEESFYK